MHTAGMVSWAARAFVAVLLLWLALAVMRWFKKRQGEDDEKGLLRALANALQPRLALFIVCVASLFVLTLLVPFLGLTDGTWHGLVKALDVLWVVMAAWAATLASWALRVMVDWKYDLSTPDNLVARQVHTKINILQRIVIVLIWIGAFAAALMLFDRFRMLGGTLLASAGVLSIVIGLSAQKTFGAILAGIQVALSHPINIDDVVIVEGEWGRIEDITFTYVVVRIWDLRRLVVPVNYFLETPFQNWTRTSAEIIGSVFLHVDFATPIAPLRAELERLCQESPDLWNGATCVLQVTDTAADCMTLRAIMSSPNASKAWDLRCKVREGLIEFLQRQYPECLPRRRVVLEARREKGGGMMDVPIGPDTKGQS